MHKYEKSYEKLTKIAIFYVNLKPFFSRFLQYNQQIWNGYFGTDKFTFLTGKKYIPY